MQFLSYNEKFDDLLQFLPKIIENKQDLIKDVILYIKEYNRYNIQFIIFGKRLK